MSARRLLGVLCLASAASASQPGDVAQSGPAPPADAAATRDARVLEPGAAVERELSGGQSHLYAIRLEAGQFLRARIEQRSIDVAADLVDPEGRALLEVNAEQDHQRSETLVAVGDASGRHLLRIRPVADAAAGTYSIKVEEVRPATARDGALVAAERSYEEGVRLRGDGLTPRPQALPPLEAALAGYRQAGDRGGEAKALLAIAAGQFRGGSPVALERAREALAAYRSLEDQAGVAGALTQLGQVHAGRGEMPEALRLYNEAIVLARSIGHRRREAIALSNAGIVITRTGEAQRAVDYYTRALALARDLGDRTLQSRLLGNTGTAYFDLGDYPSALDHYEQALTLVRALGGAPTTESRILNNMANARWLQGEEQKALELYAESLTLARRAGAIVDESRALNNLADAYTSLGQHEKAREHGEAALAIKRRIGDLPGEAMTLRNLGQAWHGLGDMEKALECLNEALRIQRRIEERYAEPDTLVRLAAVERDRGRLEEALAHAETAIERMESLRALIAGSESRASFGAGRYSVYEFHIDLLMRRHARDPGAGHDAAALQASERARARALLEALVEGRGDIRQGIEPSLLGRERAAQAAMAGVSARLSRLLTGSADAQQVAAARTDLERLTAEYRRVQTDIRRSSPRYAALTQPTALDLPQIQRHVLDADTVLLEYMLGEEGSYLWVVTPSSLESHALPRRAEIEAAARRVYELLTLRQAGSGATTPPRPESMDESDRRLATESAALSRMLLGPVAARFPGWRGKRLAVVASGALEYLPFGALPLPAPDGSSGPPSPLVTQHEIVSLPSASALAEIRREAAARVGGTPAVAVFADPVFDREDPRVTRSPGSRAVAAAAADAPGSRSDVADPVSAEPGAELRRAVRSLGVSRGVLSRLPFSRREALAIAGLAGTGKAITRMDFQASRASATSGELGRYPIVHFATHGVVHDERPELSGLVLSMVDERGRSQDGFLRMHEIYNLELPARMVVLSACQTALGKRIRGEGLMGLTRGFFYAGAERVVASLWQVDDESTAELMRRFYRGMLKDGRRPAEALRTAQLELLRHPRWSAPFYWAGFVLQGEWR